MAGARAQMDMGLVHADAAQFGEMGNINQDLRSQQTQVQRRHKALATGDQLAAVTRTLKQGQRFLKRCGPHIIERIGFHPLPSLMIPTLFGSFGHLLTGNLIDHSITNFEGQ